MACRALTVSLPVVALAQVVLMSRAEVMRVEFVNLAVAPVTRGGV